MIGRRELLGGSLAALIGLAGCPGGLFAAGRQTAATVLRNQVRLGGNLMKTLTAAGRPAGATLAVSPASLLAVMAMVEIGASDKMSRALHDTLGFAGASRAGGEFNDIRQSVASIGGEGGALLMANLLVFDPSIKANEAALAKLRAVAAEIRIRDLRDRATLDEINGWVNTKTSGMIPAILEDPPEKQGLVAVNALYFRDRWQVAFNPASTRQQPFRVLDGPPQTVSMMHSTSRPLKARIDDRFMAVELGYATDTTKLVLLTTRPGPAALADFAPALDWLGGDGFEEMAGTVALPRLSLSAKEELLPLLDRMGLAAARARPDSLSGFTATPLLITRIIQKLELRLDEEGTTAAAATAVTILRSMQKDGVPFVFDRPFVMALRDVRSGLVLAMAYVARP